MPTVDSVRYSFLLAVLLLDKHPVLLTGMYVTNYSIRLVRILVGELVVVGLTAVGLFRFTECYYEMHGCFASLFHPFFNQRNTAYEEKH